MKAIEILPIIAATLSGTETEKLVYLDHFPLHQKLMIVAVLLIIEDKNFDRCKLNIYEASFTKNECISFSLYSAASNYIVHVFRLRKFIEKFAT